MQRETPYYRTPYGQHLWKVQGYGQIKIFSPKNKELKIVAPEREARRAGGSGGVGTPPGRQPHDQSKLPPAA